MTYHCAECGHRLTAPDELAGSWTICPGCGHDSQVPDPSHRERLRELQALQQSRGLDVAELRQVASHYRALGNKEKAELAEQAARDSEAGVKPTAAASAPAPEPEPQPASEPEREAAPEPAATASEAATVELPAGVLAPPLPDAPPPPPEEEPEGDEGVEDLPQALIALGLTMALSLMLWSGNHGHNRHWVLPLLVHAVCSFTVAVGAYMRGGSLGETMMVGLLATPVAGFFLARHKTRPEVVMAAKDAAVGGFWLMAAAATVFVPVLVVALAMPQVTPPPAPVTPPPAAATGQPNEMIKPNGGPAQPDKDDDGKPSLPKPVEMIETTPGGAASAPPADTTPKGLPKPKTMIPD